MSKLIKVVFKKDHPVGISKGHKVDAKEQDALRWIGEGYADAIDKDFKPDARQKKVIKAAEQKAVEKARKLKDKIQNLANGKRTEPMGTGKDQEED